MEVYAGFLEQTDYNVGRVIQQIEELGQLDNTLVIYIVGDNGASAEGSLQGLLNEMTFFNGVPEDIKNVLKHADDIGTWKAYNHYPVGWANAMCTPFQWTKQIASHYGGTRNGLVISWPKGIAAKNEVRTQWHHVIDIVPTIYDVVGVEQPASVNGVAQKPIEGVSMKYTVADAKAPTTHTTQYFEMLGNQGIYQDGWTACTTPIVPPWSAAATEADVITGYKWQLYAPTDFSQAENLAEKMPEKMLEMRLHFYTEAAKYNVLPLDNSKTSRLDPAIRPSLTRGRKSFTFFEGQSRIPEGASPDIKNKSWSITAEVDVKAETSGIVITQGGLFSGWALYLDKGKPVFHSNFVDVAHYEVAGKDALAPGKHTIKMDFTYDGGGIGKPWFAYFSTPGVHAPHQPPKEWREKFKNKFEHGWDKQRELTHAKQLEIGIIPRGTKLTARDEAIPSWDSRSADEKKVYTRLMENYAGYMAYTDHQVGRLLDSLAASGELDNTLVMYIVGDNGASAEGGLEGTFSELASLLGVQLGLESTIKRIDEIGGPTSEPHVPVGWAWAMNAPFKWTKQVASHFGGTRNPLVVHWPKGIKSKGEIRDQFHHVIDVVPTILEACKIPEPKVVNGIPQKPIEGVSMVYSFDSAKSKGTRTTQYFELATNRAIYHDGWVACSRNGYPWVTAGKGMEFLTAPWELYNVVDDFSQANDLAAKEPEKLKTLQALFLDEAKKYDVFPLDPRFSERMDPKLRESGEPPTKWTYFGNNVWLPEPIGPQLFPRPHTLTAELTIPKGGAEGVVTCAGAFSAGWSLYIKEGKPYFRYTGFEISDITIPGTVAIPEGKVTLKTEFQPDGSKEGAGTLKLFVDGKPAGEGKITRTFFRHGLEPFEVGRDSITSVDPVYKTKGKFEFTGQIDKVTFELK